MMKQPTSVSVIAWLLIMSSGISLIFVPFVPMILISLQFVMIAVGFLVGIASGLALLEGENWGRFLWVGWAIVVFVIEILISPMGALVIFDLIVFAVITFFLFRPKANEYFSTADSAIDVQPCSLRSLDSSRLHLGLTLVGAESSMSSDSNKTDKILKQFIQSDLPWYKQSYLFLLLAVLLFNAEFDLYAGFGLYLSLISFILAIINLPNDRWYRFLWPWLVILCIGGAVFWRFALAS